MYPLHAPDTPAEQMDHISVSSLSETFGLPEFDRAIRFEPPSNYVSTPLERDNMYFEREHRLSKPRPLNPDLNVHMDFSPLYPSSMLPNSYPNPAESTDFASAQPKEFPSKSKRRDFQLAVIPSSDGSDSPVLDDLSSSRSPSLLEIQDTQPSSDINSFLEECGLPPLDFLQMTYENKDFVYQSYIRMLASRYHELAAVSRNPQDQSALDMLREVNDKVGQIMRDNSLSSRVRLIDNIRCIGKKLKKDEKRAKTLDEMLVIIENEDTKPPVIEDLKTMDPSFDKRMEIDLKRLMHMRTYKARYKELLFLKYKIVELINRQREDKVDQFIEVDKLIPIVEKHKFPLRRVKEILSSRAFTPEWKIRELRELFSV